jgi:hypothetical protein
MKFEFIFEIWTGCMQSKNWTHYFLKVSLNFDGLHELNAVM